MNRTKGFIMSQIDDIRKKLKAPLECTLSGTTLRDTENAKRILLNLKLRKESGPICDQRMKKNKLLSKLAEVRPKVWKNIPIPLTDCVS